MQTTLTRQMIATCTSAELKPTEMRANYQDTMGQAASAIPTAPAAYKATLAMQISADLLRVQWKRRAIQQVLRCPGGTAQRSLTSVVWTCPRTHGRFAVLGRFRQVPVLGRMVGPCEGAPCVSGRRHIQAPVCFAASEVPLIKGHYCPFIRGNQTAVVEGGILCVADLNRRELSSSTHPS